VLHPEDLDAENTVVMNPLLNTHSRIPKDIKRVGRINRKIQSGAIYLVKVDNKKESIFGIDVDKQDDCKVTLDQEGNPDVEIYGSKTSRIDMVDFIEERYTNHLKGKSTDKRLYFSGVSFDNNGKII